jgi:L-alanine-DL-glutamate epimerase-like enolase superfamily enzyme
MKPIATIERWPTAAPFTIARGTKSFVDVVVARVCAGERESRGEGSPIYYRDETAAGAVAMIEALGDRAIDRAVLQTALPPGAARNALDCALWDMGAKDAGTTVCALAGLQPLRPVLTALTISLGDPAAMEAAARRAAPRPLLKLKLGGDGGDRDRVAAVRIGAPGARLIVDANEAWGQLDIEAEAAAMAELGVELIEQPIPAGQENLLDGMHARIPFVADESLHTRADLDTCTGRFQAINIKLDKAGGLTEALALRDAALARGLDVMVGCMLSTSLAIAPALLVAQGCRWVDLDGPLLLARDRAHGLSFDAQGFVHPADPKLWG